MLFQAQFTKVQHQYSFKFINNNFAENYLVYNQTKSFASLWGPKLWKNLLDEQQKALEVSFLKISQIISRSSRPEVFCKKGIPRNFGKFTGKHLCQSLFFNKVTGLQLY